MKQPVTALHLDAYAAGPTWAYVFRGPLQYPKPVTMHLYRNVTAASVLRAQAAQRKMAQEAK